MLGPTMIEGHLCAVSCSIINSINTAKVECKRETTDYIPSSREIAKVLGLHQKTFNRIKTKVQGNRDLLEQDTNGVLQTGTIFSQVVKRKGWTKINKDVEESVISFIENHPNVVQSPIMNDFVCVNDKANPTLVHKVPKLLLQVSIRELHNDLIEQLPEASKDGIPLISDSKLREMIPPQVKKMTDRYKQMCGCTDCVSIGYYHRDNNKYTSLFETELKKTRDSFLPGSRSWTHANEKLTTFVDECERNDRPKDVLSLLQCQPVDTAFPDLVHYNCAKGTCEACPQIQPHSVLMNANKFISFHAYEVVSTCTEHGVLACGTNVCVYCHSKRDGEVLGKLYKKR